MIGFVVLDLNGAHHFTFLLWVGTGRVVFIFTPPKLAFALSRCPAFLNSPKSSGLLPWVAHVLRLLYGWLSSHGF
jgi:hypothetical protein